MAALIAIYLGGCFATLLWSGIEYSVEREIPKGSWGRDEEALRSHARRLLTFYAWPIWLAYWAIGFLGSVVNDARPPIDRTR